LDIELHSDCHVFSFALNDATIQLYSRSGAIASVSAGIGFFSRLPLGGTCELREIYKRRFAMITSMSIVGTLILILDIFAILSVLLGSSSVMRKLMWIAIILLLPVIGMVLYFLLGRSSADARAV
jgi:hypothetical protein